MLTEDHHQELNSSRITEEVIETRGYRSVTHDDIQELNELQVPSWAMATPTAFPGLLIPMYRATGELITYQFKPGKPQKAPGKGGKLQKYASMRGSTNHLDVHPYHVGDISDVDKPLWITEGVKKADSITSRGQVAVALTGVWNWREKNKTLGDWEDIPLRGRTVVLCFDADAREKRMVMLAMQRAGRWLVSKGVKTVMYLIVPPEVNGTDVKGVDDYFAAGGDLDSLRSHAAKEMPGGNAKDATFTDSYLTDTVCEEVLEGRFLFASGMGWMKYQGNRWVSVDEKIIKEEIRLWSIDKWKEILEEQKSDPNRDIGSAVDGWRSVLSGNRQQTLARMAAGPLFKDASEFDSDPDLLNTPDGVVDLRTGELIAPDPSYLMTKVTGVRYRPGFHHGDFTDAMKSLPPEVHDWYRVRMGQAFTGHVPPDDLLIVQQGGGENGKSTLGVCFTKAAGDYHVQVSHRVLTGNKDQHPTELMDFRGARLALMEETPESRQLNTQALKEIIGTPQITARRIRQDSVTFEVSHSMFVNTNFAPMVAETDHGTWRRLAMLRFPYTFRKRQEDVRGPMDRLGDPTLRHRCTTRDDAAEAALAWIVDGARQWYEMDMAMPSAPDLVAEDTQTWRKEGDPILQFADEKLIFGGDCEIPGGDLHQEFSMWLTTQGNKPWSAKLFKQRFEGSELATSNRLEFRLSRTPSGKVARMWFGVALRPSEFDLQKEDIEDRVTPVTGDPVSREVPHDRAFNRRSVTRDTPQVSGPEPQEPTLIGFDLETRSLDELWSTPDPSYIRLTGVSDDHDN